MPRAVRITLLYVLLPLVVAGGLVGYLAWRAQRLPPYVPPPVRYAPPEIGDEVRLAALGDWGSGVRAQAEVIAAIDRTAAGVGGLHGGLLLGDNFYPKGVDGPDDERIVELFEEPFDTPFLGLLTWHAVLGNHDYDKNPRAQIEYTARSHGRWSMPKEYYRLDLPDGDDPLVTVLALDTNLRFPGWDEEMAWLETQLVALADAPQWVVAMGHGPLVSYSTQPDRVNVLVRDRLSPLLRRHPVVDLYLAGHAHCMEMIEHDGPPVAVLGGGGKRLHGVESGPGSLFHRSGFGFGLLRVTRERLTVEFRDTNAQVLHVWERTATEAGTSPSDVPLTAPAGTGPER